MYLVISGFPPPRCLLRGSESPLPSHQYWSFTSMKDLISFQNPFHTHSWQSSSTAPSPENYRDTVSFSTRGGGVSEPGENACGIPQPMEGQDLQLAFLSPPLSLSFSSGKPLSEDEPLMASKAEGRSLWITRLNQFPGGLSLAHRVLI